MLIVAVIHNSSLGNCTCVNSWDEGVQLIKKSVKTILRHDLTEQEELDVTESGEYYSDSDVHNVFTFSIAIVQHNYDDEFQDAVDNLISI